MYKKRDVKFGLLNATLGINICDFWGKILKHVDFFVSYWTGTLR